MKNYYDILEVSEKASKEVIEKAYKVLAKKYHPDLQQTPSDKKMAEEKIKEVNEAYEILTDDSKRANFDSKLHAEQERIKNQEFQNMQKGKYNYGNSQNGYQQNSYQQNGYQQNNYTPNEYYQNNYSSNNYGGNGYSQNNGHFTTTADARIAKYSQYIHNGVIDPNLMDPNTLAEFKRDFRKEIFKLQVEALGRKIKAIAIVGGVLILIGAILYCIPPVRNGIANYFDSFLHPFNTILGQ